jgi:hypothetical protein
VKDTSNMQIPACSQVNNSSPLACPSGNSKTSTPASSSSVHRSWCRVGGADLVFLILALLIFSTGRQGLLDDPGLGWHLRNIDAMLAEGGWLRVDSFSEPRNGQAQPWRSNQWLGEIPFWLGERWAGREGIAAVAALLIAFMLRCLYCMLLRDGSPWPAAVFWISQAAMGVSCSWVARPNLFTLLFMMVTARICVLFHEGRCSRRKTLWLLPLFALWANTHGGFVAGFTLLGATFLIELALAILAGSSEARLAARVRAIHILLLLGSTFLCTLVNPYGLSLYSWVFQLLGEPFFMDLHQEWKSPNFHGQGAIRFESLMLLFPMLLALSKRRPHLVELGLAVLWFHFALASFRSVPLWVLIVVPLLARSSLEIPWIQQQARHLFSLREKGRLFHTCSGPAPWLGSAVGAIVLLGLAYCSQGRLVCHQPEIIPSDALDHFLEIHAEWRQTHGYRPVAFHSYDWGGYLTWHGGPDFRNWIDDRNEVQGKEHIEEYFAILGTDPGWKEKLDRAHVELICIQSNAPLTFRLSESSAWRERYRDAWAVIFERVEKKHASQF